jgi:hypothetical protein
MTSNGGGGDRKVISLTDRPLAYRTAIARIKLLWRQEKVTWSRHFEDRLIERQLDMTDVESIIHTGQVVEHSRPGINWRYTVDGKTVEGKKGGLVCEIDGDLLVFISVMLRTWRNQR